MATMNRLRSSGRRGGPLPIGSVIRSLWRTLDSPGVQQSRGGLKLRTVEPQLGNHGPQ